MRTIAIEDKTIIEKIKIEYRRRNWIRDLLLFVLSINTGIKLVYLLKLKVSDVKDKDLLKLKVSDVKDKDFLKIKDNTKVTRIYPLNNEIKELIKLHCEKRKNSDYLFASLRDSSKTIDRIEVFRKFKAVCLSLGLSNKYSISSWRKTFGYHYYKEYKDLALLQWLYGQNSPEETLKYIGEKEDINDRLNKEFKL